jgi:hypothetical protein
VVPDDASEDRAARREEKLRRLFQVGSERFLADLANNIRTEVARVGTEGSTHWVGMAQGAVAALVAVGEVPYDKQHEVVSELLRPLIESGAIQEVTRQGEVSATARGELPPDADEDADADP